MSDKQMLFAVLFLVIFLFGCFGCSKKNQEYLIDGAWLRCDYISETACGQTLRCGQSLYECQTNVQRRMK